jgi:hypothetical protein
MGRVSTFLGAVGLLAACPASAVVGAEPSPLGFGYCPPPVVPACIAASAARRPNRAVLDGCGRDVLRFTQSLGAYRLCLDRESQRAIGTGNAAIARFRCITQGARTCR